MAPIEAALPSHQAARRLQCPGPDTRRRIGCRTRARFARPRTRRAGPAVCRRSAAAAGRSRRGGAAAPGDRGVPTEPNTATVLLDRHVVRVHPNGLSEVFAQRVVQVRTDSGAQDNKDFLVRYTPGRRRSRSWRRASSVRDASGGVDILQASDRDDQDLSEPWYGLYYDYRAQVVRFEGLRAGDVLEVQYVVSDVSRENQLAGYFGDLQFIAEAVPKRQWDYTLLAPPGRQFYFARPAVPGLAETSSDEGGEHITRFVAHDVPRIEVEPAMPGPGRGVTVSSHQHLQELGRGRKVVLAIDRGATGAGRHHPSRRRKRPARGRPGSGAARKMPLAAAARAVSPIWTRCARCTAWCWPAPVTSGWSSAFTASSRTRSHRCWRGSSAIARTRLRC